jgi:hypothetical protein
MPDSSNPYLGQQNPYLQSNIDNTMGDMTRQYNLTTQPAFNSAMVHSGSFGNAGVDQMNSNANLNQQKAQGATSAAMRMQDYGNQQSMYQWDQGFNRSLYNDAYGQNQTNLQTGFGLLGTQAGYNTNNLNNGTTIQNTPFNYWSQFNNAANSVGQGYGANVNTTGTTSNPFTSALGGAQLAHSAMGYWNNAGSGGGGSSALNNTDSMGNGLSMYGSGGSAAGVTPYL